MSGQTTRSLPLRARASSSKSRALRVRPCTQTTTSRLRGSPHSRYETRCRPFGERQATERRRGPACGSGAALDKAAALDHRAPGDAVALPVRFDAQLGKIRRRLRERREGNAELRLEAVLEPALGVVLGVVLGVELAHHEPAQALAEVREAPDAGDAHD